MEDNDLSIISDTSFGATEFVNPDEQKKTAQKKQDNKQQKVAQSCLGDRAKKYPRRPSSDSEEENKSAAADMRKDEDEMELSDKKAKELNPKQKKRAKFADFVNPSDIEDNKQNKKKRNSSEENSISSNENRSNSDEKDQNKKNKKNDQETKKSKRYKNNRQPKTPREEKIKSRKYKDKDSQDFDSDSDDDRKHKKSKVNTTLSKYYCLFEKKNDGVPYKYLELFEKLLKFHLPSPSQIDNCIIIPHREFISFRDQEELKSNGCSCNINNKCKIHEAFKYYFPFSNPASNLEEYKANQESFCCLLLSVPILTSTLKLTSEALHKFFKIKFRQFSVSLQLQIHPLLLSAFCNEEVQIDGIRAKVSDLPVILTTEGDRLKIEYFWDKQIDFERMIREKRDKEDSLHTFSVSITTADDQYGLIKELISDKDDIALEQSVKEYKDLVKFIDVQAGEIKFETKIFLKTIIEEKIRNLIKNILLTKFNVISECEWLWSPVIEQLFIRNSRYAHNIFRAEDPDFNVVFRVKSQSVFIYTLNKDKMSKLGNVKTELIKTFCEIFKNKIEIQYMFPLDSADLCKSLISNLNCEESRPEEKYPEKIKNKCDCSCVLIDDEKITKIIKRKYQLYKYIFIYKQSEQIEYFKMDLKICQHTEERNGESK